MRVVMKIGTRFEAWACAHIDFEELDDTWPYIMEARFGVACLAVSSSTALADFDDNSCLRVALHLRLPVKVGDGLPVPVDVTADNPVRNTPFRAFRIQTVREVAEDDFCEPFTTDDDPFDGHFMPPLFALYGVLDDHLLDHIADRSTYADAVELAEKLAPGVRFPKVPGFGPAKPF